MSIQLYARMGGVALAGTRPVGVSPDHPVSVGPGSEGSEVGPGFQRHREGAAAHRGAHAGVGVWYPPHIFGVRLVWDPAELLFGAYGLMGCPTTMVALSLLFLKYPAGNRRLFHLLTAYAVFVGAAMVALLYVPDVPSFILGLASLALIVSARRKDRRAAKSLGRESTHDAIPTGPKAPSSRSLQLHLGDVTEGTSSPPRAVGARISVTP
jgi:hypothetical protein